MGICSNHNSVKKPYMNILSQFRDQCMFWVYVVDEFELTMLQLIYEDLSKRSPNNLISRETFNAYFRVIGLWGEQIFNRFAINHEEYMNFEEFLLGLQSFIKCSEEQRIHNLFKLYDLHNKDCIAKTDFLQMLQNYPKEELKFILNDQLFLKEQQIIKTYDKSRKQERKNSKKKSSMMIEILVLYLRKCSLNVENLELNFQEQAQSMASAKNLFPVSNDSMASLNGIPMKGFETNITLIIDGQKIETCVNLSLLTKKYVDLVYKTQIDQTMTEKDFSLFVVQHPNLMQPLYSAFNYNFWGFRNQRPLYKEQTLQMSGELYKQSKKNQMKAKYCELYPNTLMQFKQKTDITPSKIICLNGLIIEEKINLENQKFGFEIFHKQKDYVNKMYHCSDEKNFREWQSALQPYLNGEINKKYSIFEKIGEGRSSTVYKCQQKQTNLQFALKVINKILLTPEEQGAVKHEVDIMKLMNHSCIAKMIDTVENRNYIYVVTELIIDGDLFDYVEHRQYLEEREAALVLNQLIDAIAYIHSIGIIHRDLKPENIMVVLKNNTIRQVKLIDFGFADYLTIIQSNKQMNCGTLNYVAPEVLQYKDVTSKIDNFALGVILYYMLSGFLPFDSDFPNEITQNTLDGNYTMDDEFWRCVSDDAKDLVRGLLKVQPNERLSLDEAKHHPWMQMNHK